MSLHLGSGKKNIPGFINIDGNPTVKNALYLDLRNKLPFGDGSVKTIYTSNVLEHFFPSEVEGLLKEMHRVLEVGGFARIVVPDLRKSVEAYLKNDLTYFSDYPRKCNSIGGRFSNFISNSQFSLLGCLNPAYLLHCAHAT